MNTLNPMIRDAKSSTWPHSIVEISQVSCTISLAISSVCTVHALAGLCGTSACIPTYDASVYVQTPLYVRDSNIIP
jgi:hypothetical protein